jgi:UPF0755 protein
MTETQDEYDDLPDDLPDEDAAPEGRRRRRRRFSGVPGCLAVLVAIVVLVGGGALGFMKAVDFAKSKLASPGDYPGPGHGHVTFQVKKGDTLAQMGRDLKAKGIVKSVDSFIEAANAEPKSSGIQVGYYDLQKEMPSADALEVLVDPGNIIKDTVTIPEGLRLKDIVAILAKKTKFEAAAFQKVLDNPAPLKLPAYADGNPEGYLFPSTYDFGPKDTPTVMLKKMVDRWRQSAEENDLETVAAQQGKTPEEIMTIASLIQAEGRGSDMGKISRVIYNRLDGPGDKGGTNGLLQIDASTAYGLGLSTGSTEMTPDQLATDTPYNTRLHPGLPPTPIDSPGDDAIKAATHPTEGPWYYYVTVNLATGKTKFYADYAGFLQGQAEYKRYCETSDRC